jgi:hypothetical protein
MDLKTAATIVLILAVAYSAWLTSIASNGQRPPMIACAAFFQVGIVHGVEVWLGGW